jgi:protein TonB
VSYRSQNPSSVPPRLVGIAVVVLLHVGFVGALLQFASTRSRAAEVAPTFVKLIAQPEPRVDQRPLSAAATLAHERPPRFALRDVPLPAPIEFAAPEPIAEPIVAAPMAEAKADPVAPPAASAPPPKTISTVEYIRPPQLEYPALSRRFGEQGRVLLRVLIGREGRAERVEVQVSSGSRRLDEAAIKAAREALYRPYSENGVAIPVWALVPTLFELS